MTVEMTIVRTRSGWAVRGGQPYYLTETRTKSAAQEFIDQCARARAELAAHEAAKSALVAELLAARGISVVDFRQFRPGDLYAGRPESPVHAVTDVRHLDTGASVICYEVSAVDRACGDLGSTLLIPAGPVYGVLRNGAEPVPPCACGHPVVAHDTGIGICDDCDCNAYRKAA